MMWHSAPLKLSLIWGVCCLFWLAVTLLFGQALGHTLLPLLRWELSWLAPQYPLAHLDLVSTGLEMSVQAKVTTRDAGIIADHYLPTGSRLQSSTLVGHLWQPLILMLSLISTAALTQRNNLTVLVLLCPAATALLLMVDVPFVLIGALHNLLAPDAFSAWVLWMNFLDGGGRLALAIAAALFILALCPPRVRAKATSEPSLENIDQ